MDEKHFIEHLLNVWPLVLVVLGAIAYAIYKLKFVMPDMERRLKDLEKKTSNGLLIQDDLEDEDGNPLFRAAKACQKMREDCMKIQDKRAEDFCDKVGDMEKKLSAQISEADSKRERAKNELNKTVGDLSINVAKVVQQVEDMVAINQKNNINTIMEKFAETLIQKLSGLKGA